MTEIILDAAAWRNRDDFYDALLPVLGAPAWHGRNLEALNDTLSGDDVNKVRTPIHIDVANAGNAPPELWAYLKKFAELIDDLQSRAKLKISLTVG
jgi:RNAse (barnase) inhibitor barstar